MLELIINRNKQEETICLVENGILIEKYQSNDNTRHSRLEGNIYAGKVADILPGMQSAFIDYGDKKKGLMYFKDAIPRINEVTNKDEVIDYNTDIRKILKTNQKVLIQIKKDCNDKKGAKVSTHITIPSRYVAFMPNTDIITVSQKIPDGKRKEELLDLARKNVTNGNGLVIRTFAENADDLEIIKDIKRCTKKWNDILDKYEKSNLTDIIYSAETIQEKIVIDLKLDKIVTNSKEEFEKLKKLLQFEEIKNVKLELKIKDNLLDIYELESQIKKVKERKIWLNCGGFITIDRTEALTAIDVNTGKFTGNKDLEATVFKVNKEATKEIAKQLRVRDIGGIVIIDYIDMKDENNKNEIQELLKNELKKDRAKTQVEGFTKLNLVEMTRKHICSHLDEEKK